MSRAVTLATARRVIQQLRRDRRTVAMLLVISPALIGLLKWVFDGEPGAFDRISVPLMGLFALILMFLTTSIAMLRERTSGTLERLMTMPLAKLDLLAGYGLAFAAVAMVQAGVTCAVAFGALSIDAAGPVWAVVLLTVASALLGTALGLLFSAFASSEFQAVQFMPTVIMPQLFLSGLFVARDRLPELLHTVSGALPFTYAYDAMATMAVDGAGSDVWRDAGVVAVSILLALALGATTLRRRTA